MIVGGVTGSAPGRAKDHVLGLTAEIIAGNVLLARMKPLPRYRNHYWAPFINGVYLGQNYKCHLNDDITIAATIPFTSSVGSIYFEHAGRWQNFDGFDRLPSAGAERVEALTALNLMISWTGTYSLTTPVNDTSLSFTSISGAKRGLNCTFSDEQQSRGRLYYSITTDGSNNHTVRFYNGLTIVANGTRNGDGVIVCNPANFSGLTVKGTLTYTTDIDDAYIELRWPSGYQVHYSTSSLSFPRAPEALVEDTGSNTYMFLSPNLVSGVYNFNVLQVDDAGNVQSSMYPTTAPLTINTAPPAATNVVASIESSGGIKYIRVDFDAAAAGITHNVYVSDSANTPIDTYQSQPIASLGTGRRIATISPDVFFDSAIGRNLPVIDSSQTDYTSAFSTLETAFNSAVSGLNTAFDAGEAGFITAFQTALDALETAIQNYGDTLIIDTSEFENVLSSYAEILLATVSEVTGISILPANWTTAVKPTFGHYIAFLGSLLNGDSSKYHLSDGTIYSNADGSTSLPAVGISLFEGGKPFIFDSEFRFMVTAVEAGIEEQSNTEILVTLNPDGTIMLPVPNQPSVTDENLNGLTLNLNIGVSEEDSEVIADSVVAWIAPLGTTLDIDNLSSSQAVAVNLDSPILNYHSRVLV